MYMPSQSSHCAGARSLISALREADAIVIGSPGYHGGISGLVKNALDYTEAMSKDEAPYFEGRAVGCIATGAGWQGANTTLIALRNTVHALRGWPTPLGIALNTRDPPVRCGRRMLGSRRGRVDPIDGCTIGELRFTI
jgi:FMN reductase